MYIFILLKDRPLKTKVSLRWKMDLKHSELNENPYHTIQNFIWKIQIVLPLLNYDLLCAGMSHKSPPKHIEA